MKYGDLACNEQSKGKTGRAASGGGDDRTLFGIEFTVEIAGAKASQDISGEGLPLVGVTAKHQGEACQKGFLGGFGIVLQQNLFFLGRK